VYEQLPSFVSSPSPDIYLSDAYLVVDLETTNREHGSALDAQNSLLLACWSLGATHPSAHLHGRVHHKWADEFGQRLLEQHISECSFVVCHHTKFELGWFRRCGLDLRRILTFCTMIGEKVLHGNKKVPLSLDATAARRGMGQKEPTVAKLIKAGVCPSQIPAAMLENYCHQDVSLTEQIFLEQRKELKELALLPVAYCRNLVTPVLADIEFNGMRLDQGRVTAEYEIYSQKWGALEKEFSDFTEGINVKSSKQMGEYIYDKLAFAELVDRKGNPVRTTASKKSPEGGRKTDKETITQLTASTDEQRAFLEITKKLIILKTPFQNLEKMRGICEANPNDPRVYASFNQTVVQTDRLSSTARNGGFNFQNFDRAFRRLFCARADNRVLCDSDAPQLEFRIAAYLGNDDVAKEDIRSGVDVHAATSKFVGVNRQEAKSRTFRPLYGGRSGTPRERKYIAYFTDRYAGIYRTQTQWTYDVARDKCLTTATGLKFYWPNVTISKDGYVSNTTHIFNYPIQSLATADIMPLVLVCIWHRITSLGDDALLINTVHDSHVADVQEAVLDEYKRIVVQAFTVDIYPLMEKLYGIKLDVPLGVGIKTAKHWADTKIEEKYDPGVKTT
jgi:DNA polymerase I-like protein with 3'-5' exonuclease and polymerase domains